MRLLTPAAKVSFTGRLDEPKDCAQTDYGPVPPQHEVIQQGNLVFH